jgi:16S rRNA C1402 (ribose-2'-O) methylase RsmI
LRATLGELAGAVEEGVIPSRGEFVVIVGAAAMAGPGSDEATVEAALAEVERLVAGGAARGDAARQVAAKTGIPRRRLYMAERSSGMAR